MTKYRLGDLLRLWPFTFEFVAVARVEPLMYVRSASLFKQFNVYYPEATNRVVVTFAGVLVK